MTLLTYVELTEDIINEKINKTNISKSHSHDNVYHQVIKDAKGEIVKPLLMLLQKTLEEGAVPQDWNDANVTLIHKGGANQKQKITVPLA